MQPTRFDALTEAERCALDALFVAPEQGGWDRFYQDRAKPCPFFGTAPDESLAGWIEEGRIGRGRALDLGCGNGRNAIYLARQGFSVDAADFSQAAIDWAAERVADAGVAMSLRCRNVFALGLEADAYDLIVDSGCFHHLPPHRRACYVRLVLSALKPGAWLALACFRPEGGSGYTDSEVYERRSLGGGLGYTEQRLNEIWSKGLRVHTIRQMHKPAAGSGLFGEPFLWALLAQRE